MYDYGYDYSYGYTDYDAATGILGGAVAIFGIIMLISAAVGILMIISQWKVYKKAGKGGWECLIPIYNIIVLLQIVELPMWYIALFFVPFANIYATFKIYIELAHKFGKSTGFGVGLALLNVIFFPILAFGKDNVYNGGNNPNQPINNIPNNVNVNNDTITFGNMTNTDNTMNYNNPNPQPTMSYNQSVNTEINPIPQPTQTPFTNPQPQVNVVPTTATIPEPVETNSVNNVNNMVNTTIPQPVSFETPTPVQNVNPQPTATSVPNMVQTQQPVENSPINNFNNQNNSNM